MPDTRIIRIEGVKGNLTDRDLAAIEEAGRIIREGGLVAFPTETVYGLGGDAFNPRSSSRIYAAKGRPSDNPLIVHIADVADLHRVALSIPDVAYELADRFWPGPLTMIFRKKEDLPRETTGGLDTVAVRLPSDPVARALIRASGGFVAAPSANLSGRPSPTSIRYVMEDLDGRVDAVIDGGDSLIGLESSILDLTSDVPMILRPGAVTKEDFLTVLKEVALDRTIYDDQSPEAPKAPGMKYRHYAPRGELTIVHGEPDRVVPYINERTGATDEITGVIATDETGSRYHADVVKNIGSRNDEYGIAQNLYRILREMDDEGVDRIYSEDLGGSGIAQATMNRLLKAAGHKEVTV